MKNSQQGVSVRTSVLATSSDPHRSRSEQLSAEAKIARGSEAALAQTAGILGFGAAISARLGLAGVTLASILEVSTAAAVIMSLNAGITATRLEAEAAQENSQSKSQSESQDTSLKKKQYPPTGRQERDWDRWNRLDSYGGRASAHDPGRSDAINRTC
jgi:hypothetical protein